MRYQSIYNRLRRIEGQIRGIEEMVQNNKPEQDILIQLDAAKSSISSAVASLIEKMLQSDTEGKVVLNQEKLRYLLRIIKK